MFGISGAELAVLLVIALALVGPARLPRYAGRLAALVRAGRQLLATAQDKLREEVGDGIDVDALASLDPRDLDPRAVLREALQDSPVTPGERRPG